MTRLQETLARNMREARSRLGYSQMRLAELCGLSTSFIAEIELQKKFPSAANLEKIAEALGLKPYLLFYEDDSLESFDKHESLAKLSRDLKKRIFSQIDDAVRKHLRE